MPVWLTSLSALAALLLWPHEAWAWGPVAHIDYASEILRHGALLQPAIRDIIQRHPRDFLYGAIAADIIVWKNLADAHRHCHAWPNGFGLFHHAEDDAQRALALGFISHLAADIVAHNYYIPFKMLKNLHARYFTHVYWEVKFDSFLDPAHYETAAALASGDTAHHDEYLNERLAMTLLPFSVNKRVFNGVVINKRFGSWHKLNERFSSYSGINRQTVELYKNLVLTSIRDILNNFEKSPFVINDATGRANLGFAKTFRKTLQQRIAKGEIKQAHLVERLHQAREELVALLAEGRPVSEIMADFGGREQPKAEESVLVTPASAA